MGGKARFAGHPNHERKQRVFAIRGGGDEFRQNRANLRELLGRGWRNIERQSTRNKLPDRSGGGRTDGGIGIAGERKQSSKRSLGSLATLAGEPGSPGSNGSGGVRCQPAQGGVIE